MDEEGADEPVALTLTPGEVRLHEHSAGILTFLANGPPNAPVDCKDAEGWQRGYASARAALMH